MKSDHVRISCNILDSVDKLVKKKPLYGSRKKFIELAVIEKLARLNKK